MHRVHEFRLTQTISSLKEAESCAPCMARWILKYSEEAAAGHVPRPMVPVAEQPAVPYMLAGAAAAMAAAKIGGAAGASLRADAAGAGAVNVEELTPDDW